MMGAKVRIFSLPPPTEPALFDELGLPSRVDWQEGDIRDAAAVGTSLCSTASRILFFTSPPSHW
jgi:hypothetical protein